jgi:hypothetical protein
LNGLYVNAGEKTISLDLGTVGKKLNKRNLLTNAKILSGVHFNLSSK